MKRTIWLLALAAAIAFGAVASAQSEKAVARQEKMFQKGKHETIQGEVTAVNNMAGKDNKGNRVALMVKTDKGNQTVFLGPEAYLNDNHFAIHTHDQVTVDGSLVDFHKKNVLMAQRIQQGSTELRLRDDSGRPLWAETAKPAAK